MPGEEGKDTLTCDAAVTASAGQADKVGGLNRIGTQSSGGSVCQEFVIDYQHPLGMVAGAMRKGMGRVPLLLGYKTSDSQVP